MKNVDHEEIAIQKALCVISFEALITYLKGSKIAIDAGANIGGFFLCFIHKGIEQVHAFEPVPLVFDKLLANYGNDSRLVPRRMGLSDQSGKVEGATVYNAWTLLPASCGRNDVIPDFKDVAPFDFYLTTIDKYVEEHQLAVDFIKLDVDGYEMRVLKGARQTLATRRPNIYFELSYLPSLIGDNCEEMCKLIFDLGYCVVTMDGQRVVRDWLTLIERFPWRTSLDVMLIPKEKL